LLRAELSAARSGDASRLPPRPWPDDLPISDEGLGADSLEKYRLAAAVNEMFHIHEVGVEDTLLIEPRFGDWVNLALQCWAQSAQRITFRTSGSRGTPKRCTHRFQDLVTEAEEHAARLRPKRVLAAVPAHHIYGFIFTLLLPELACCPLVDIRHHLPALADFRSGDVIVSFPDHWEFLVRSMPCLPPVTGVSSTAPMPTALAHELRSNGLDRLIEVYGASETAGIAWRDDPSGPFHLLNRWAVADESHSGAPAATARPLCLVGQNGQTALTPDEAILVAPRSFILGRRPDGAVQVGGMNVFPEHVAAVLASHPMVAHARVRQATADEGGRLKALIVPHDTTAPADDLRQALYEWTKTGLTTAERPRSFTIASCLPKGLLGKDSDWSESE
jgi:4-coumarate--CoA ligase